MSYPQLQYLENIQAMLTFRRNGKHVPLLSSIPDLQPFDFSVPLEDWPVDQKDTMERALVDSTDGATTGTTFLAFVSEDGRALVVYLFSARKQDVRTVLQVIRQKGIVKNPPELTDIVVIDNRRLSSVSSPDNPAKLTKNELALTASVKEILGDGGLGWLAGAKSTQSIQTFHISRMIMDLAKHVGVPEFRVLRDSEVADVLRTFQLNPKTGKMSFPRIAHFDPAVKYAGARVGDVMRTIHRDPINGRVVKYRVVSTIVLA